MHRAKVIEAWVQQRNAAVGALRSIGPTLYVDDRPVACWLDRADENGAQLALHAFRMGRSWLRLSVNEAVRSIRGRSLRVLWPLPTPTSVQHVENIKCLVGAWQRSVGKAARSTHYALGYYQIARREAAEAKLYAWAFDLHEPKLNISRQVLSRARRNATTSRRKFASKEPQTSPEMLRALWRGGREIPNSPPGPVMLRLSSDGETIETSDGEKVSLSQVPAALLWGLACECRQQRRSVVWRVVSERPCVGQWRVQVVRGDGSLQVGCHDVAFAEIARLAVRLALGGGEQ